MYVYMNMDLVTQIIAEVSNHAYVLLETGARR